MERGSQLHSMHSFVLQSSDGFSWKGGRLIIGTASSLCRPPSRGPARYALAMVEEEDAQIGESTVRKPALAGSTADCQVMVPQTHPPAAEAEVGFAGYWSDWQSG